MKPHLATAILLVTVCLAAKGQLSSDQARAWHGFAAANLQYDWLRPSDAALQEAAQPSSKRYGPSWSKRTVKLLKYRAVWVGVVSPCAAANAEARERESAFKSALHGDELQRLKNAFVVFVAANAPYAIETTPHVAIQAPGIASYLVPDSELVEPMPRSGTSDDHLCLSASRDVSVCQTRRIRARFALAGDRLLKGIGVVVVRWDGEEARFPIDFDYLW